MYRKLHRPQIAARPYRVEEYISSVSAIEPPVLGYLVRSQDSTQTELLRRPYRAVSLAVRHRLPTAAARVLARVNSSGICGGQSDTWTGFLRVLRFPLPLIHCIHCSTAITIYHSGPVENASK
jgi:hypothetical protein